MKFTIIWFGHFVNLNRTTNAVKEYRDMVELNQIMVMFNNDLKPAQCALNGVI